MPLYTMLAALVWSCVNSYIQGRYFSYLGPVYPSFYCLSPTFLLGVMIYFFGMFMNIHSDKILTSLRKPNETEYKIPHGGAFKYLSAPNLVGEVIEFLGYVIASNGALPAVTFWCFTSSSLLPKAVQHHFWYHKTFKDYPKNRKALIPFIF